jgi:hypothetical protein
MTAATFIKNLLIAAALMIGGGVLFAFLGIVVAPAVADWLWPPLRPRRGGPAIWPLLAGICGAFFGLVGGGLVAGYYLDRTKSH